MRPAFKDPEKLARAAFRTVTRRIANGYWPHTWMQAGGEEWIVFVSVKKADDLKPSEKPVYVFEFRCDSPIVGQQAVRKLHQLFFPGDPTRSKKVQSAGQIIKKRS